VEYRILGPLEVVGDGGPLPLGGSRERVVLARLLLSANQVVSSDALTEDLWSGAPPEGAAQALWVHISRLRKTLRGGGGDEALLTRPPGYVLRVGPEALDSACFETMVEQGRRLVADGDPAGAAAAFREALALWRGAALADVADAPFARAEAARLEEARLAALEERIDVDLACGRHGALVGELAGLTREHPLRERLWAQRMLALYRAGRQAEALRAYQEIRRHLGEELGIEPGEELRRLETAMLRHERHLDWVPRERPDGPTGGVVSFLFTDVVGSTKLLQRMGDDAAGELRRRHFALLREALAAHGGTEVKTLGDGLMAAFASPLAALRCAVAIQRAVAAETNPGQGPAVAVRVGLHAGAPIGEDDDYFGTPVVVAQRLCARARGGQILASSLVQGLVGNRGGCAFSPLGGLVLKGLTEPVAVCEVGWDQPPEAALPLPLPLQRESSAFVGRDEEVSRLEAAWEEARAGRRQLVLVAGEPGVGKTRLAAEFAKRAHTGGGSVLFGRCDEATGIPYQPFVEALDVYLRQAPTPALGRLAGELVRLVPELPERVGDLPPPICSDPETERYRLFDAVAAWLAALSGTAPAVLVIDDLHWASRPTLSMLGHLLRSGERLRLLMVVTYRDTDLDITAELTEALADFTRQPGIDRIRLAGLDEAAVTAYMEAYARHELDDAGRALAATVHASTAGNPFFVGQVLRHLAESEALVRREGRWSPEGLVSGLGIPDGARDVIAQRLTRLPAETGDLLGLAAVIGDRFELDVLVRAAGEPEVSTLRALDPAITARLITDAGGATVGYRFVHALVRATLYDCLPRARRVEFHRRAAHAIEAAHDGRLDDDLPALAHHYARAGRDERRAAVHYATRAGDRALSQLAPDEAITYYHQALELLDVAEPAAGQRIRLLIALGEAQRQAGDPAHRETLLAAARLAAERRDADTLARAVLANARPIFSSTVGEVDDDRVASLEAALEATKDDEAPTRARLLAVLGTELVFAGDRDRRVRLADEALALARRAGDDATLAQVLLQNYYTIFSPDTHEKRLAYTEELIGLAERLGDPVITVRASVYRARTLAESGNLEAADPYLDRADRLAEELGQPTLRWLVGHVRTLRIILAGDLQEGERRAYAAFELGQATGQRDAPTYLASQLFFVRFDQGRLGELEDRFAERVAALPGLPVARAFLALLLCELDRPEEARAHYEFLAADDFSGLPLDVTWMNAVVSCAAVCTYLADEARARVLFGLLVPYASQIVFTAGGSLGAVAHYLALLATTFGDFDEAERRFVVAATTHQRIGAPNWLARTQLEWARMLLTRRRPGDEERARDLLGQAVATARDRGLNNIERRAVQLLT
jgi:DNA-binding SARP family transcriptional activator